MTTAAAPAQRPARDLSAFGRFPLELIQGRHFVLWCYEERGGEPTKVPYTVGGYKASTTNPDHWATWEEVLHAYQHGTTRDGRRFDGIGRVFAADDFCAGIDLDDSLDDDGKLLPWAQAIFDGVASYAEISPSGKGVKVWARGRLDGDGKKRPGKNRKGFGPDGTAGVELYDRARFFTVTGNHYADAPRAVIDRTPGILTLWAELERAEKRDKAAKSKPAAGADRAKRSLGRIDGDNGTGMSPVDRCILYIDKTPDAIAGDRGHDKTLRWGCETYRFGLSDGEAMMVMQHFNALKTGGEEWTDDELRHKLESAKKKVTDAGEFGCRLKENRPGYHGHNGNGNGTHRANGKAAAGPGEVTVAADPILPPPPPIPLDNPIPPPLPAGVFTGWLGDMIYAVAESTETPPEMPATFGLGALSAAAQKTFSVRVETDYFEPVNVWPLGSLPSGNRKTSVMVAMIDPLTEWERRKAAEMGPVIEAALSERKSAEARIGYLRDLAKKAKDQATFQAAAKEVAELEAALAPVPTVPALFEQDITPEHTGTRMAENGERLAIVSDEAGIFGTLGGRYSSGIANLDLYLQGHAGAPVKVARGNRPPVHLKHPALTIAVSPQPSVLKGLAGKEEFRGRGLLARFLYMVPASRLGYRQGRGPAVPPAVSDAYRDAIMKLADVPPDKAGDRSVPHVLFFSEEARAEWWAFWHEVEPMQRPDGRLYHVTDWAGKLPGAVARIAGLLHLADYASQPTSHKTIDAETVGRAVTFGRYLIEHALIAFGLMGDDPNREAAIQVWDKIAARRKTRLTARDCWHPVRSTYRTMAAIDGALDTLIDHGYLIEPPQAEQGMPRKKAGRPPSRRFYVNPLLAEGWDQ